MWGRERQLELRAWMISEACWALPGEVNFSPLWSLKLSVQLLLHFLMKPALGKCFYYPLKEETRRWYLHTRTCSFPEEFRLIRVGSRVLNTVLLFNLLTWNLLFQNQQHLHKSCNRQPLLKIMQHRPASQLKARTVDCLYIHSFFKKYKLITLLSEKYSYLWQHTPHLYLGISFQVK